MDLSVLIVSWNTQGALRRCLAAPGLRVAREILVIDNASQDDSAAMVREEFPTSRLIANETNRNYAAASNQGLELAQGERVLLLNPDAIVPEGALETLVACLEAHPAAVGVAPLLVSPDGTPERSLRGFPTPLALVGEITGLARLFPSSSLGRYRPRALPTTACRVEQPMASCLLLRTAAVRAIGGFDERFPLFFNDVDLCYRLIEAGGEIWFEPAVRVEHESGASTKQIRATAIRASHRGLRDFYRRHYRGRIWTPCYAVIQAAIAVSGGVRAALAGGGEG